MWSKGLKIFKLDFIKIEEDNLVAGVGTAGNIWIVLNALLNIDAKDQIYVDMTVDNTINTEVSEVNSSLNPWEYYFKQIDRPANYITIDSVNLPAKIDYSSRYKHSDKICSDLRKSFFNHFKLRENIQDEINDFYNKNIKGIRTLGIQVRLTDMAYSHNVKKLENYILRTKQILADNKDIKQVFLATDDKQVIDIIISELNIPVIYLEGIYRATKEKPDLLPYDRYEYTRPLHRYNLGREVILDIFLLSKCSHLLKADVSCVSHLAVFFSETIEKTHFLESTATILRKKITNKIRNFIQ